MYFDSFGSKYISPDELNKIIDNSITHNVFRIQNDDFIMCEFYFIAFIEDMIPRNVLLDYTNLFSPNDYQKNDKTIYNYLKEELSLDFLLQIINGTKNCILQELNHNELVTEKHKKA